MLYWYGKISLCWATSETQCGKLIFREFGKKNLKERFIIACSVVLCMGKISPSGDLKDTA